MKTGLLTGILLVVVVAAASSLLSEVWSGNVFGEAEFNAAQSEDIDPLDPYVVIPSMPEAISELTVSVISSTPTSSPELYQERSDFMPENFKGPTGPPKIIGPRTNPPNY